MSHEIIRPRLCYKIPSHEDNGQNLPTDLDHRVFLRHPGYPDTGNILLALPALDHPQGGIHYETARVACAILANNRWDGFLTETQTGDRTEIGPDIILRKKNYYFRVSENAADEKYPIVPSFDHWRFPHDNLPESWTSCEPPRFSLDRQLPRQSNLAATTLARDVSCRITNHIEGTEHAHLVPRSEERWFDENDMFQYTIQQRPTSEPVNDAQNAILLRSDLHTIFDQRRFAIVPKSSILLVHVVAPGPSIQLTNLYHNVSLQPLADVAIQHILARFAWTIFTLSVKFMQKGLTRRLCVYVGDEGTRIADYSGDQCRELFFLRSKTRSQSSRKRQQIAFVTSAEDEDDNGKEEYARGRKKRRWFDFSSLGSSLSEKVLATSEESSTSTNTETFDKDDESTHDDDVERQLKRRCLASSCDDNDSTLKRILDPSS